MNDRSASPEAAFGQHLIRTPTDTFVWGSLTSCWNCEQPMLVWDTRIWARGKYAGAPGLRVKPEVGEKRWENHPEVHRAVDKWIHAAKSDIPKATIQKRRTKASGRLYGAFVCPGCDSTMGQFFISCIRPEEWSLLSGPTIEPAAVKPQQAKAAEASSRQGFSPVVSGAALPPGMCDWCGKDPHPEYECLWRRLRDRANIPDGSPHYSDRTYAKIADGEKPEHEGAEFLRRMLDRCVALPRQ